MKYTVWWHRFPNGKETDEMVAKSRDFDSFEKALQFLQDRVRLISSRHWAGGQIETSEIPCKVVYEIDWEGNEEDLCCEKTPELEQEKILQQAEKNCKDVLETTVSNLANIFYEIANVLIPVFSEIAEKYSQEKIQENIRPSPYESQ